MRYRINLKKIKLFGYHGVLEEEKSKGQKFEIDVQYTYNLNGSDLKDNIDQTIDYMDVYKTIIFEFNRKRCDLIETLSDNLIIRLKKEFPIISCKVKIRKIDVDFGGEIQYVEIDCGT